MNENSWSGGLKYLDFAGADITLHQETKLREVDAIHSAEDTALRLGWKTSLPRAASGEHGGASAGVGITIRKHLGLAQPDSQNDPDIESRLLIRKLGAVCKGGIHVGSVYLHDMVGPNDPKNKDILEKIAFCLRNIAGSWVLGGDWN